MTQATVDAPGDVWLAHSRQTVAATDLAAEAETEGE
jgi:hypothetical protein